MSDISKLQHIFVGFGFGPIQAGFFVHEAVRSGNFSRIVIAEVDRQLVEAVRANHGSYTVNIAHKTGIEVVKIDGVELLNSTIDKDRKNLQQALTSATEIVTSLPSVMFYSKGDDNSVAALIAKSLQNSPVPATFIYTAENNNYAAQILEKSVNEICDKPISHFVQYINTVIGKMSQIVTESERISQMKLQPIAPGLDRAFLVEEFDHILINRNKILGFKMGS